MNPKKKGPLLLQSSKIDRLSIADALTPSLPSSLRGDAPLSTLSGVEGSSKSSENLRREYRHVAMHHNDS